ncbi:hypothetical protein OJF2_46850 [Aquisphaera giovannonii]|uniref:DUF4935 domain-containing protein n=1 Tax=Aquisphaera giovannonii TaxID=406548 RepID=A0A5B9W7R1_9BACT|nr:PIN domain-containing protein [Aquisphaera giovannonii]QEH36125.1 hypothetical protein OJF2_46850 [Aquisphaera giovannonii]
MSPSGSLLYIETNFLMSIATGRDPSAASLLAGRGVAVRLAVPQVCLLEALAVLNDIHRDRNQFENTLAFQVGQLRRDITSRNARALWQLLIQARLHNDKLVEDTDRRLRKAIRVVTRNAQLIPVSRTVIRSAYKHPLISDPTDNLILQCILEHARGESSGNKAFLSGNTNDFSSPEIRGELAKAGIAKYFPDARNALGWIASLPNP